MYISVISILKNDLLNGVHSIGSATVAASDEKRT